MRWFTATQVEYSLQYRVKADATNQFLSLGGVQVILIRISYQVWGFPDSVLAFHQVEHSHGHSVNINLIWIAPSETFLLGKIGFFTRLSFFICRKRFFS